MCELPEKQDESAIYDEKVANCTVISKPMASRKLASKVYKLVKKAGKKRKTNLRLGLKIVQAKIRKGERGLVVIAGNVLPIDILCHMPAVCEDKNIPYIFVPDKADLGAASGVMGIVQILLLLKDPEYEELYEKVVDCIEK
ncbi:UNVERIFIED_CONTAM: hypothetical protein RMT77_013803 [Armadillidium vulgare]